MSEDTRRSMDIGLVVVSATVVAFVALGMPFSSFDNNTYAQNPNPQSVSDNNTTLYVMGDAQTMVKPDKVTLSLSVETTNRTAEEALNANSEAMNKTLQALISAGVLDNEISTSSFNISPNYDVIPEDEHLPPVRTRDIISYTVTNSINIESKNLLNVSQWIDTAVQAGVNDISSISFDLSDEKSELIENDLLKQAIEDAQNKADIAASALGLKVIGVASVSVEGVKEIPPQPYYAGEAAFAGPAPSTPTPIIVEDQEVTSSVTIVFLIS
jgi:uncharacterized protein